MIKDILVEWNNVVLAGINNDINEVEVCEFIIKNVK